MVMLPVALKVPFAGWYSSALASGGPPSFPKAPPAMQNRAVGKQGCGVHSPAGGHVARCREALPLEGS